jgi:hypothetical protein
VPVPAPAGAGGGAAGQGQDQQQAQAQAQAEEDDGALSELDDEDARCYLASEAEARMKGVLWHEMNKWVRHGAVRARAGGGAGVH